MEIILIKLFLLKALSQTHLLFLYWKWMYIFLFHVLVSVILISILQLIKGVQRQIHMLKS